MASGGLAAKWKQASPITKIAVTWISWATICLSGYYFARIWAGQQRVTTLQIRQTYNDEFSEKLELAKAKVKQDEQRESSSKS